MLSCGVLLALLSKRCKLRLAGSQALQNALPYLKPTGAGPWWPNNCCGSPCLRLAILLLLLVVAVVVLVVVVVFGPKEARELLPGAGQAPLPGPVTSRPALH